MRATPKCRAFNFWLISGPRGRGPRHVLPLGAYGPKGGRGGSAYACMAPGEQGALILYTDYKRLHSQPSSFYGTETWRDVRELLYTLYTVCCIFDI